MNQNMNDDRLTLATCGFPAKYNNFFRITFFLNNSHQNAIASVETIESAVTGINLSAVGRAV